MVWKAASDWSKTPFSSTTHEEKRKLWKVARAVHIMLITCCVLGTIYFAKLAFQWMISHARQRAKNREKTPTKLIFLPPGWVWPDLLCNISGKAKLSQMVGGAGKNCFFFNVFCPAWCILFICMHIIQIFWKEIGRNLLFLAVGKTDTKVRRSTGVATANSTNKYQNANELGDQLAVTQFGWNSLAYFFFTVVCAQ